ncbi:hypothetical protein BVG94_24775 (plasmid) [Serratia marcescens]|nr:MULTISPECIES: YfaZ family outer membrane protein [Serratia]ASL95907.1 hypothetical protein BVG94_24775 [Serratia marcescens]
MDDNGIAFPVGGGVRISLPDNFAMDGEGCSAPEYLTNSVRNVVEADGGISMTPITPLTLKASDRYSGPADGQHSRCRAPATGATGRTTATGN